VRCGPLNARKEDLDIEARSHEGADSAGAAPGGTKISDICREHGISEATYYVWKKQYAGLGLSELCELRQLREENAKLKRWLPICRWTGTCCRGSSEKSCEASAPAQVGALDASRLRGERA
jgi:putative transposase